MLPGADESTPSRSHYFSWINNTNEGPDEAQTLINLDFFKWLNREYGILTTKTKHQLTKDLLCLKRKKI